MKIETKFRPEDRVYALISSLGSSNIFYRIIKTEIKDVNIKIYDYSSFSIDYHICDDKINYSIPENHLFATKEDLLEYISNQLED